MSIEGGARAVGYGSINASMSADERRELGEALVRVTEERDQLQAELGQYKDALDAAREDRKWEADRADEAARLSAEARDRADDLKADIAELNGQIDYLNECHERVLAERDEARDEVVRLGREGEELLTALREANDNRAKMLAQHRRALDEVVRLRTIIAELGAAEAAEPPEEFRPEESQSGLCEVGKDKVTCIVTDKTHRLMYHSGRPVPAYAEPPEGIEALRPEGER